MSTPAKYFRDMTLVELEKTRKVYIEKLQNVDNEGILEKDIGSREMYDYWIYQLGSIDFWIEKLKQKGKNV